MKTASRSLVAKRPINVSPATAKIARMKAVILVVTMLCLVHAECRAQFVSYSTPGPFALTITASRSGISLDGQVSLVTPIGTFSMGTSYPAIRNHTLVILRDRTTAKERVYRVETLGGELQVDVNGRGRVTVKDREVIIDMTDGVISQVRLKTWERGQRSRLVKSLIVDAAEHLRLSNRDYDAAIKKLTEALRYDETNVDANLLRSFAYWHRKSWIATWNGRVTLWHIENILPVMKAAVADSRKAVGLDPKNNVATYMLALSLKAVARLTADRAVEKEADEMFKKARKLGWDGFNTDNLIFGRTVFDRYDIRVR